jgi:hypothetical protein
VHAIPFKNNAILQIYSTISIDILYIISIA